MTREPYDLIFILPHTHWDREWYLPFEQFRFRLVQVVDRLLAIMRADPSYERFTLDGQSIVIDDYLALRPEEAGTLRALVAGGRLKVGPWYVLPDEFLVSGEALIRNLLIGHRKAAALGAVMRAGYIPDSFGHIAQLPQIFSGFGLRGAIFSRGVGDEGEALGSEFWWEAPDGSRVLAVHQVRGYCNLVAVGYRTPADLFDGDRADPAIAAGQVRREVTMLAPYARAGVILLNAGCDHQPAHPQLPQVVDHLRGEFPEIAVRWAGPDEVVEEILARRPPLGVWRGELRGSRYAPLIPGVLSTRVYLKQANAAAGDALERWAEPFATVAWALGEPDPRPFLRHAWTLLLQNHPHDSICGCSVDAVHREMLPRFARVRSVAEELTSRSLRAVAARIDSEALPTGLPLAVFNPLNWARSEPVRCTVSLPGRVAKNPRVLDGTTGRVAQSQILHRDREVLAREVVPGEAAPSRIWWLSHETETAWGVRFADFRLRGGVLTIEAADAGICGPGVVEEIMTSLRGRRRPLQVRVERTVVEMAFLATDVPALGYKTYVLTDRSTREPADASTGARAGVGLAGRTMENAHLSVTVHKDGTIEVTHKATGVVYQGNVLEDTGDAGDEYDYSPVRARAVNSTGARGRIEARWSGPIQSGLAVTFPWRLPAGLQASRQRRTRARVVCPVRVEVTLAAESRRIEVVTTIENHARDHRVRALFPTGVRADRYAADAQFSVVERILRATAGKGWSQPPQRTAPHESWIDVSDGGRGVAVLSTGLAEHEVVTDRRGLTVALTLLRCVGWLSRDDLRTRSGHAGPGYMTPEAQCQGRQQFRYALLPHAGRWGEADLVKEAQMFRVPMGALAIGRQRGTLQGAHSFLTCEGAIVTALKPRESGDAVLIRIYNPHDTPQRAVVGSALPHTAVREVTLAEEDAAAALTPEGGRVTVDLGPLQIRTLALLR